MAKFIDLNQIKNRNEYLVKKLEDGEKSKIYKKIYLEIKQKKFDPEIYVKSLQTAKEMSKKLWLNILDKDLNNFFQKSNIKKLFLLETN